MVTKKRITIDGLVAMVHGGFNDLTNKIDKMDQRLDTVDWRLDRIDGHFLHLETEVGDLTCKI